MTDTHLRKTPARARAQKPLLLFFYSLRSGPSRRADGYLAQVLQRGRNHQTFKLLRIAQEERPDIVERFHIASLPTLLVVEANTVRGRLERPQGVVAVEHFLLPWLETSEARIAARPTRQRSTA